MSYNTKTYDDEDIFFTIKKSDIKKIADGKQNFNVKVCKTAFATSILERRIYNNTSEKFASPLTMRELEVLKYLIQGKNNNVIASELNVSKHTIKAHVANILQKLEVKDRFEAAIKAIQEKIV